MLNIAELTLDLMLMTIFLFAHSFGKGPLSQSMAEAT